MHWKLNTSNKEKLAEFRRLFSVYDIQLTSTEIDLEEIVAEPLTVVAHKASQLEEHVLVEDTSLEVEGANVGINIRWLLDHLSQFVGRRAVWSVLLAYRLAGEVIIHRGAIEGSIVAPAGNGGFGFDPYFLPAGSHQTLAEAKPDCVNARALAVQALVKDERFATLSAIQHWDGEWQ